MKTFFNITLLIILFSLSHFSQDKNHRVVLPDNPTSERSREIHKPNVDDLPGFEVIESLLLKSECSDWQTVLRNSQREFYEEEGFDAKDKRTTINKIRLDNGFLLTENIIQNWYGSVWVNYWKYSYTYDGNNNQTEYLYQTWDGFAWVNVNKYIYLYLPTRIEQFEGEISTYSLSNNYPNPFNPATKITYSIPEKSNVSLKVFDLLGGEVAELVKSEIEAGTYDITFNATILPSGVYFYKLQAGSFVEIKKMILMK
jgi:hypothetical protein